MTPRLPRLTARRKPDVPPIVQAARDLAGVRYVPSSPFPAGQVAVEPASSATRYPWGARTGRPGQEWAPAEAAVLLALAAAGGDLTAHRTVHLEET